MWFARGEEAEKGKLMYIFIFKTNNIHALKIVWAQSYHVNKMSSSSDKLGHS